MKRDGSLPQWPLYLIAAGATVTVWSGWVGLGEMTGFGRIHPLPGIWDGLTINTAITLPIGVEAYAAYALGAWLTRRKLSKPTRKFASISSVGALILGACGQVAYHLLAVGDHVEAPAWITTIVSCLPVLVLGMAATLTHLIRRDEGSSAAGPVMDVAAETGLVDAETDSLDRSEMTLQTQSEDRSQDRSDAGSETHSETRSEDHVQTRSETTRKTGLKKARKNAKTGPKGGSGTDFEDLLGRARDLDTAHLQDHGRHISAENLRAALRIAKPLALDLVKQVRGGHIDVAKEA